MVCCVFNTRFSVTPRRPRRPPPTNHIDARAVRHKRPMRTLTRSYLAYGRLSCHQHRLFAHRPHRRRLRRPRRADPFKTLISRPRPRCNSVRHEERPRLAGTDLRTCLTISIGRGRLARLTPQAVLLRPAHVLLVILQVLLAPRSRPSDTVQRVGRRVRDVLRTYTSSGGVSDNVRATRRSLARPLNRL